jgi:hypothetical protein
MSVEISIKFNRSNKAVNKYTTCYSTRKYPTVPQDVLKISINLPQYKVIIFLNNTKPVTNRHYVLCKAGQSIIKWIEGYTERISCRLT